MELKEVVNLRKLKEFCDETLPDEQCDVCPFRRLCLGNNKEFGCLEFGCLVKQMLFQYEDNRDIYDLERAELEESDILQ